MGRNSPFCKAKRLGRQAQNGSNHPGCSWPLALPAYAPLIGHFIFIRADDQVLDIPVNYVAVAISYAVSSGYAAARFGMSSIIVVDDMLSAIWWVLGWP